MQNLHTRGKYILGYLCIFGAGAWHNGVNFFMNRNRNVVTSNSETIKELFTNLWKIE